MSEDFNMSADIGKSDPIQLENKLDDNYVPEIQGWEELDLDPKLLRGIFGYGFEKPSPIQQKAIKPVIDGRDVIAQAQSGTGKTATFAIGALQRINISETETQVLILSPTRELSTQTAKVITSFGNFMEGLKIQTLFGGSALDESSSFSGKHLPHIICGCPGRVHDMMRRDRISCKTIKLVILDEADEMLSAGFKEQVYNIFQYLNDDVQVCLFSATIPEGMNAIVNKIMRNPVRIDVKREQLTLEGIKQFYIAVDDDRQKYVTLKNLYSVITMSQSIIYCNSVRRVQDLYEAMCEDDFSVCRIHSNMDKSDRDKAFEEFRSGKSRVLISSNVTARGIDIQQVSIVINFDLPKCVHTYLHRIGRSGRWGRKGVGINFITRRDVGQLKKIEEHYCTQISEMPDDIRCLIST
jgi:translation initiation factor 4A